MNEKTYVSANNIKDFSLKVSHEFTSRNIKTHSLILKFMKFERQIPFNYNIIRSREGGA